MHVVHVGVGLRRVLADDVERGELPALHRAQHLGEIQAVLAWIGAPHRFSNVDARPRRSRRPESPGSLFGSAPMSPPPCTLFWPRSGLHPQPQRPTWPVSSARLIRAQHVVDGVVVLGDAERPADHAPSACAYVVRGLANDVGRNAGGALGELERVRLDAARYSSKLVVRIRDERSVGQTGVNDLARHRVGQCDVAPDVQPQPHVGPLGGGRASRVDHVEPAPFWIPLSRWWNQIGCASRAFDPQRRTTSVSSTSGRSSCRRPPRILSSDRRRWERVRSGCSCRCCCCRTATRASFCARKFTSFVDFEQLKIPIASGPCASRLRRNPPPRDRALRPRWRDGERRCRGRAAA